MTAEETNGNECAFTAQMAFSIMATHILWYGSFIRRSHSTVSKQEIELKWLRDDEEMKLTNRLQCGHKQSMLRRENVKKKEERKKKDRETDGMYKT